MMRARLEPSKDRSGARVLAAALLAGCLSLAAPGQEEGAVAEAGFTGVIEQVLGMAEAALEKQEPQIAESHYRTALREGWQLLGAVEVADGDLPAARAALGEAIRATAAGTRISRTALALVQIRTGELEEAVSALRVLASEKPRDLRTRLDLVHALVLAGHIEEARQELESLRPEIPEPVAGLERALAETEADGEARREAFLPRLDAGRLTGLSPARLSELRARVLATQGRIYRNLGVLHARAGRPQRAAAHFARADEIAPPRPPGSAEPIALGTVDLRQTPPSPAVKPLRADEETLWETATVDLLPVLRSLRAGQPKAAETALRQLLEAGDSPAARDMLAILLTEEQRYDEAEKHLLAAIAAKPDFEIHLREHLARLYLMRGREADAIEQLRAAAPLGALPGDLALKLAAVELAAAREPQAKELLRTVIRKQRSVRALLRLAELAAADAGSESAQVLLHQARGLAPNCEEVLALSGRAELAAGSPEQAIRALEPLQRMHPEVAEYAELLGQARMQAQASGEPEPLSAGL